MGLVLFFGLVMQAQERPSYTYFCPDNNFKPRGYFFGLGASIGQASIDQPLVLAMASETTTYDVTLRPKGGIGLSQEIGAFYIKPRGVFRILELGIGYRQFTGSEHLQATRVPGSDLSFPDEMDVTGEFKAHRVAARFNMQAVTVLGTSSYVHFGPGLFFDNTVSVKSSYDIRFIDVPNEGPLFRTTTALNFTAGIAFKIMQGQHLDFYAHAPIYALGSGAEIDHSVYSSDYRDYVVGVRYFWQVATPDRVCPAFGVRRSGARYAKVKSPSGQRPW